MIKGDGCKINGLGIAEINIQMRSGSPVMKVGIALIKDNNIMMGRADLDKDWPDEVARNLKELMKSIEAHLAGIYFEGADDDRDNDRPKGIIFPTVGSPKDRVDQV